MEDFRQIFSEFDMDVAFKTENPGLWEEIYTLLPYRPVNFLTAVLDYQIAYQSNLGKSWSDLSCVLLYANKPVGIWPLSILSNFEIKGISSQGVPVSPPLFVADCPDSIKKKCINSCLRIANQLARRLGLDKWCSAQHFHTKASLDGWQILSMAEGARCTVSHELYINLTLPLEKIKSHFRKSFKSLVTSGERLWNVEVICAPGNLVVWDEFKALHVAASGRVTRNLDTWALQHSAIVNGDAFLITLRDDGANLVGAGYFIASCDEGFYAVGAYDRSLFSKPLGHVVQYQAIKELQRRKCRWYRIGTRYFPGDAVAPTEKELSISHFKEGFATHLFPSYILTHQTDSSFQ